MKNLLSVLGLGLLALIIWGTHRYMTGQKGVMPYPFDIETKPTNYDPAQIVIIGDRMGLKLENYAPILQEKLSVSLTEPIKIRKLSQNGAGIHRTLHRLKKLNFKPKVIIYTGSSQELYEKKFHSKDIPIILQNIKLYEDYNYRSLLYLWPVTSRFIYNKVNKVHLNNDIVRDPLHYQAQTLLKRIEVEYKLFELQFKQLLQWIKKNDILLLVVSNPLNYDIPPKQTCQTAMGITIDRDIQEIKDLIKQKNYKEAYQKSKTLTPKASGHAMAHYVRGKLAAQFGNQKEAKNYLRLALSFDCYKWRGDPVFNDIQRRLSRKNDVLYFDFARLIYDESNNNITFIDDIFPQPLYYERAIQAMAKVLKKVLHL